ncbi:FAD:protein FMN transferase [Saccharospirillum alexandrii]|uniref:FAD:protein FMN transferase n=1 Tax=Saccharospirillum alexandrii TaxID=2448477 RepID=UPI001C70AE43|nr:FAD:protein FMN transferase [Saccharospirillum alexandrii]
MNGTHLHSVKFRAMGSPCELIIHTSQDAGPELLQLARDRLTQLEQKYSRYRPDSITTRINAAAGTGETVPIDQETLGLLHYADSLHTQSKGLFDITSGVLRRAWDFRSARLPEPKSIEALLPSIGWRRVTWSQAGISLPTPGMELDFGGFVKEYAADQVAQRLRDSGVEHGLVNLGGDIVVIGPQPDGQPWRVGIRHPRQADTALLKLPMTHGAIATSGDYERFMLIDGVRYCHLLNPFTGFPVHSPFASATVIADQCLIAGSFSSLTMLTAETDPDWITRVGLPYLLIDQSMQVLSNMESR